MRAGIVSCCLSVWSTGRQPSMGQCHKELTCRLQGCQNLLHGICKLMTATHTEGLPAWGSRAACSACCPRCATVICAEKRCQQRAFTSSWPAQQPASAGCGSSMPSATLAFLHALARPCASTDTAFLCAYISQVSAAVAWHADPAALHHGSTWHTSGRPF